jgi:hypothetical protein
MQKTNTDFFINTELLKKWHIVKKKCIIQNNRLLPILKIPEKLTFLSNAAAYLFFVKAPKNK